jgi:peptide-methionine (S)-S-oxide reductase
MTKVEKAAFAAGCFWGVEEAFRKIAGVIKTAVGFMGGTKKNPTYKEVCAGKTGHAETVLVEYDPSKITYGQLLDKFFSIHDPTRHNGQGLDFGKQYRSVIFYFNKAQKSLAESAKREIEKSGKYKKPIATIIEKAGEFYRAEEYHQKFLSRSGRNAC